MTFATATKSQPVFWPFKPSKCLHVLSYTCTILHVYSKFAQDVRDIVHPFNIRRNSHRSDIKCTPDLPLSRHLLSSSHKNERALQKHKMKIIENNHQWTRQDRESLWIRKTPLAPKLTCNIKNTFWFQLYCSPFLI
jgi:hypothetical protein